MSVGLLGVVLLGLYRMARLRAKEMQFCAFILNSNEFRGTWNILYSELHLGRK